MKKRHNRRIRNEVTDPVEKKRFAEEIREMFDPVEREKQQREKLESLILRSARPPTTEEVLNELAEQSRRMRKKFPQGTLLCGCGGQSFLIVSRIRSGPEATHGLKFYLDDHLPPYDLVVFHPAHKGKKHGGVL